MIIKLYHKKLEKKDGRQIRNKAGYTATSCGRVGRGGNAHFHTFRLVLTDGPTDEPTDGRTDKASYRVACPQLKMLRLANFTQLKHGKAIC